MVGGQIILQGVVETDKEEKGVHNLLETGEVKHPFQLSLKQVCDTERIEDFNVKETTQRMTE